MQLKIERIKKGLTQKQLREKLHISPNKLVAIERGDLASIRVKDLQKIANILELPVYELFPELANNAEMEVDKCPK